MTGGPNHVPGSSGGGLPGPDEALARLAADPAARPILVALDFDGTLAPLQDDPALSRILPAGVEALQRLSRAEGVHLALVSGRALSSLHELTAMPPGTVLVASHGAERARVTAHGLDRAVVVLSDEQADRLVELGARAAQIARGRDGVWVETKPTAVVVHTRLASRSVGEQALAQARELGGGLGAGVLPGHDVVELSVLETSKGEALRDLRRELGVRTVLYAGDDVTDERAFEALNGDDVTIRVGPGATSARFRVASPDEFVAALAGLAAVL